MSYCEAVQRYAEYGVNVETALSFLATIPVSIHCWQGDDVGGFESTGTALGGGLAVTGNYPGRARNADELRADFEKAFSLIPGRHRANLHAIYGETGGQKVERDAIEPKHFQNWIDWAKRLKIGLDFNPTFFSHPLADDGFTLSHRDEAVRKFWTAHGIACRKIGAAFGKVLGSACVTNFWMPDGMKDTPADRAGPRHRMEASLDEIFAEKISETLEVDSVEPKLFGIGSESYVVGSHEFFLGYCIKRQKTMCLDTGHYHPTESVADKISAVLCHVKDILLHLSRGVRWDSDHVVTQSDELQAIANEMVRGGYLKAGRVRLGLDYFDATINRVAAWVIGARAVIKALLVALLEPIEMLRNFEADGDYTSRLALMEGIKSLPFGAVWDEYCRRAIVPIGERWLADIQSYESSVQSKRR
jgi:L-rhamnose isomerase